MWHLAVGVRKLNKYASRHSGDTVEVVERPSGGVSVVVADGQGSGQGAKNLSNLVTSMAVALLKNGVRDSAVHQAVHDHLYHYKGGRVSCTLTTLSADARRNSVSVTRNCPTPALLIQDGNIRCLDEPSSPLGVGFALEPTCHTFDLAPNTWLATVSDGVWNAGSRSGDSLDTSKIFLDASSRERDPGTVAEELLRQSSALDHGRPVDDMTVATLAVLPMEDDDEARALDLRLAIWPAKTPGGGDGYGWY